jgi:hypothetical protein
LAEHLALGVATAVELAEHLALGVATESTEDGAKHLALRATTVAESEQFLVDLYKE